MKKKRRMDRVFKGKEVTKGRMVVWDRGGLVMNLLSEMEREVLDLLLWTYKETVKTTGIVQILVLL